MFVDDEGAELRLDCVPNGGIIAEQGIGLPLQTRKVEHPCPGAELAVAAIRFGDDDCLGVVGRLGDDLAQPVRVDQVLAIGIEGGDGLGEEITESTARAIEAEFAEMGEDEEMLRGFVEDLGGGTVPVRLRKVLENPLAETVNRRDQEALD